MPSACVQRVGTPIGDYFVFGYDGYPLTEGQQCPADSYVLFDSTQAQQLLAGASPASSPTSFPTPEEAAAAWGASFVLVVGCYAIARVIGAVVNFIDSK